MLEDRTHHERRAINGRVQLFPVCVHVLDRSGGNARFHGRLCNGRCNDAEQAGIEGFGDQILPPELQVLTTVDGGGFGSGRLTSQFRDPLDASDLHVIVDGGRPDIERTAEDKREAQDVVDLIGQVRATGGENDVGGRLARFLRVDFRVRVGQREHDRLRGHALHLRTRKNTRASEAQEQVRPIDHIIERTGLVAIGVVHLLGVVVGPLAPGVNQAFAVDQEHVLTSCTELEQHVQAGDAGSAAADRNDLQILERAIRQSERVHGGRAYHDGRAVLIVVEDRNVHPLPADPLDREAVGGLDVLQVDCAKGWLERDHVLGQLLGLGRVDFDVEAVDARELLEQDRLAFHHRLGSKRADVTQAQHCGAVRHDGDEIAARRVARRVGRVLRNRERGFRHTGRVRTG